MTTLKEAYQDYEDALTSLNETLDWLDIGAPSIRVDVLVLQEGEGRNFYPPSAFSDKLETRAKNYTVGSVSTIVDQLESEMLAAYNTLKAVLQKESLDGSEILATSRRVTLAKDKLAKKEK